MLDDINYKLGLLSSSVSSLESDVKEIKNDVKNLLSLKWKVYGAAGVLAT